MKFSTRRAALVGAICLAVPLLSHPCRAEETDAARAQRWADLQHAIFGDRAVMDGSAVLSLEAPVRAEDAALVPLAIIAKGTGAGGQAVKGLYLVIDDNPSPLAAHFSFGPEADAQELHLRVRVDQYTHIHAVAELQDGKLYVVQRFVKAAGGCSAPAGADEADALQGLGQMRLRMLPGGSGAAAGRSVTAQLSIRHPNFNGMQMNQVTRMYTPARFLDVVDVTYNGGRVFHLDSDISMSTNPSITFSFIPHDKGTLKVVAHDSTNASFTQSFDVPVQGS